MSPIIARKPSEVRKIETPQPMPRGDAGDTRPATPHDPHGMSTGLARGAARRQLALFLLLVVGGGLAIGYATSPGEWYAALRKPVFNPPAFVFAPAWTVLYILIAVVGWRTWRRDRNGSAMLLWWAQLATNFLWSPVFFSLHRTGAALGIVVALLLMVLGFVAVCRRRDRVAASLFLPYAAWVGFAVALNASIWWMNG